MDTLLNFMYNKQNYYIFKYNEKICLIKLENNNFMKITDIDKEKLSDIINILISNDFSKQKLLKKGIIILNQQNFNISNNIQNITTLEFDESKKTNLLNNCLLLNKKNKLNFKYIILLTIITIITLAIFIIKTRPIDNSELLKKYTYVRDPEITDFYKQEYKIINITNKQSTNLLNDSYISFESPYFGYSLIKSTTKQNGGFNINFYEGNNIPKFITWYVDNRYVDNFQYLDIEKFESLYDISTKEVFERNNINNELDLIYNVILYSKKEINSNSTKNEIIDSFTFEYFRPLVIPYNKESNINKLLFFKGDKYGYAIIDDNQLLISLKKDLDEYRIMYEYEENIDKLTEEQIINIVATAKF